MVISLNLTIMINKTFLSACLSLVLIGAYAQDWDGRPIPANPPAGMTWELNPVSDSFNYESNSRNLHPEFTERWNELYINGFSGPSATSYHVDHTWISGGTLNIHGAWDATLPIIYTGCISSKATMTYPMFMEARVLQANCMLANNIWMISEDETEELDMLESYPNSQEGREYFDKRIHLSHHTFIREPFTDYQPRDEEGVFGTWYMEEDRETWRGDYFTIGVYWVNPHHAEYYINGQKVRTIKQFEHSFIAPDGSLSEHTTTFDALDKYGYTGGTGLSKPQHIIINMEQQSWLSAQNIFPTQDELDDANGQNLFKVDWIRVYDGVPVGGRVPVTGIELIPSEGITIRPGETFDFDYQISPSNATQQIVTWTTSNTTIATINGQGVVTGIMSGTVTADAVTQDGNFLGRVTVTVAGEPIGPIDTNVPVEGVSISPRSLTLEAGDTTTVTAGIIPFDATIQSVVWSSSNSNVVTVSNVGDIIAVAEGSASITATTLDGDKTDTIPVTVSEGSDGGGDPTDPTDPVVNGGTLNGGPFTFTVGDGIADNVSGVSLTGNTGTNSQYIVTDDQGNILGLPPTPSAVNFDEAGTGTCFIYHLSYEDGITGLAADQNIANLSGNFDLSNRIRVNRIPEVSVPAGETIVIEAETFTNTGGTFNDASSGGSGLGVNNNGTTINFVNSGDFADYTINVGVAGDYEIEYLISTPSDNAQIQLTIDNTVVDTTNIPNNGSWDDYRTIDGSSTVSLTAGVKSVRITASGSEQWQWNLDKITLTKTDDNNNTVAVTGVSLTPANATLDIGNTQNLSATVAPSNATNQAVSFSSSNTNVATVNGSGVVTAIAAGTATITVTTTDGNRTDTTSITVNPATSGQTPFANHVIPGQIEFEDFDNGGQGIAYNDADASNNGNSYRTNEGVDIQAASEGGFNIGWTSNGEWLEYTVNVPSAGDYDVDIRYASRTKDGIVRILSDGTDKTGNIDLPTTGGWQSYQTVTTSVNLSAGSQVLRVEIIENGINLNYMSFEAAGGNNGGGGTPSTLVIEAEDFNNTGGTFNDAFAGGPGLGVNDNATNINYVNSGDFAEYTINVPVGGTFDIEYLISTPSNDAQIQLVIDGVTVDTTNVPNNGSWDSFGTVDGGTFTLSSGNHDVRINASGSNQWQWNLDKVTLSPASASKAIVAPEISIYPNPVAELLFIDGLNDNNTNQALLYDITGTVILNTIITSESIDVSQLASGVYFLVISSDGIGSAPVKLIKK